jgi:hypothetical protein
MLKCFEQFHARYEPDSSSSPNPHFLPLLPVGQFLAADVALDGSVPSNEKPAERGHDADRSRHEDTQSRGQYI